MKMNMTYKSVIGCFLALSMAFSFSSCSKDNDDDKGAKSGLIKSIAEKVDYITDIKSESVTKVSDGVTMYDVNMIYTQKPAHMLVFDIDLNKAGIDFDNASSSNANNEVNLADDIKASRRNPLVGLRIRTNGNSGRVLKNTATLDDNLRNSRIPVCSLMKEGDVKMFSSYDLILNSLMKETRSSLVGSQWIRNRGEFRQFPISGNVMSYTGRVLFTLNEARTKMYVVVVDGQVEMNSVFAGYEPKDGATTIQSGMRLTDFALISDVLDSYWAMYVAEDVAVEVVKDGAAKAVNNFDNKALNQASNMYIYNK